MHDNCWFKLHATRHEKWTIKLNVDRLAQDQHAYLRIWIRIYIIHMSTTTDSVDILRGNT